MQENTIIYQSMPILMILTITMNPAVDKIYTVDNFQLGEVHRPSGQVTSAGGKGLNVARVAKLMGEDVVASGLLGGGNGAYIQKKVEEQGIINAFSQIQGETRTCVNVTDTVRQQCTEVLELGPTVTKEEADTFLDHYEKIIEGVDIITLSGSMPKGLAVDYYAQLIQIAKNHNKRVLLDTSKNAFKEGIKAIPYCVKPNMDEIKVVYDGDVSTLEGLIESVKYFKELGIVMPIISRGKDGAIAGLSDGIYEVLIPPVTIVNTVGSGDSFVAGLTIAIKRGFSEIDTLKMAAACGTANTQSEQTGYVEPAIVEHFLKQVKVRKIADY